MNAISKLVQGSGEWHTYRLTMRNASESAAVLGISPWTTPYQLWLMKTERLLPAANAAMQRGTELEPAARLAYEIQTGNIMQPLVLQEGAYSASLDGMTLDGQLIVEIKCPMRGTRSDLWKEVSAGRVPAHYALQIQHQLMVSEAQAAHLWVFDGTQGLLHLIVRDEAAMTTIHQGWEAFQRFLEFDTPPPLIDGDTVIRDDEIWSETATAFLLAKRQAEVTNARLEEIRDQLVRLCRHPREQGAGVSVTRYWRAGNVDYKRVPQIQGVDLDPYRGKGREDVRITENK
ncbi:YqaJ viral recombinase family protein [Glaciimonas sp. CA11.2]|uniref:lambda-exonuclease family protein n=1 Tax=Glaciimonas sp. CA11.2 TaxID=3048601 RepID=UPI002AB365F9|nr:YqaJ viral recombinase family protein [Glaciimonas sp. CA11.2]MDY7546733.1 YqaJ viral recombinase family protein [Glaciimonas sp. CA11.2]MEB0162892.1 YqaJ viral recombinase family protein [Glaciimonas sp. CA11.2]